MLDSVILLAALPFALGLEKPGGVGRLPALGWNSWVCQGHLKQRKGW